MSLPPPPPPDAAPSPTRPRRWPWLVAIAALAVALVASLAALVSVRNDREDARAAAAALEARVRDLEAALEEAEQATGPLDVLDGLLDGLLGGGEGSSNPLQDLLDGLLGGGEGSSNPLQDLLDGLLGGDGGLGGLGASPQVDPACLAGEGGLDDLLGNLSGGIEGDVGEQVDEIARLVEEERGLQFSDRPEPQLVPAAEFDRRVAELVEAQYPAEQADLDARVLSLLGAIPPGTDLKALQADLLAGQVAGYYDPATGEVVVRVPEGGGSLDANGQITLAHELDHALTDQALGLPDVERPDDSDANLAGLALVEGSATLLMQRFALAHVGLLDQLQGAFGPEVTTSQEELEALAPYLRNELLFPYLTGLAYTCRLQDGPGWPGIDAAYEDPPRSTAEVLFPERAGLRPRNVPDAPAPGGSWQEARRDTLGAAPLLWLFQAPGGDEREAIQGAEDAVRTWDGGELTLYTDGPRSALAVTLTADKGDATLCRAVEDWYSAAFDATATDDGGVTLLDGGGQAAALRCSGPIVRLGIAPDADTALALTR